MESIRNIWPLLLPVVLIQISLQIFAIVTLIRRRKVRFNNKWLWLLIILIGGMLGSIVYFTARGDEE